MVKFTVNLSKGTVEWLTRWGADRGLTPRAAAREVIELLRDPKRPLPARVAREGESHD